MAPLVQSLLGMTTTERTPGALLLVNDARALPALSAAFRQRGFAVFTAQDGVRGVDVLLEHLLDLDVLVADLDLPERGGAALLELVRVAGGERDLAVVLRGSGLSPRERASLWMLGADALVSPSDEGEGIAAAAEEAIQSRRELRAAVPAGATSTVVPRRSMVRHPPKPAWPFALPSLAMG